MDAEQKRILKERLLEDLRQWKPPEPRGFKDIVRNAADIDLKLLYGIMKSFNATRETVRAWGTGGIVPPDYERYVIIERIRVLLEADLGAATEA
jgi:hypothetical protein